MPQGTLRAKTSVARANAVLFVAIIALVLLIAAVVTNLPAFEHQAWPRPLFHSLIWLITVVILLNVARARRTAKYPAADRAAPPSSWSIASYFIRASGEKTVLASLTVVLLFAMASYYNFGRFHGGGRFLHYHEIYHYYMGSKYFEELGYDGLYAATHRALVENDSAFSDSISVVKNLRTYQLESTGISLQRSDGVTRLMSEERWREFKRDVAFFQAKMSPSEWESLLVDHGYNATPFWTMLGGSLSSRLDLTNQTLGLLAAFDPLLVVGLFVLVWYAFGVTTALLFGIFFFANFFATFDVTGGGFLRQLWFAGLIGFVCCLKKDKMVLAGCCLAVSVLDRVFPAVFVLLPVVLLVRTSVLQRSVRHAQTRLLGAFVCLLVVLGGLSASTTRGFSAWEDWYRDISAHNRWFYINQIAMRNLFIVNPATALEFGAEGWNETEWMKERERLDARSRNTLTAVRVVMLMLLIAVLAKERNTELGLGLLSFVPFLAFYPANYYCIFLAVIVVCWQGCFGLALTIVALQALFWVLGVLFADPVYLDFVHWIVALCLVGAFVAYLAMALVRNARGSPGFKKACVAMLVCGAVFVVGAMLADVRVARADRGWFVLDLAPSDVASVREAEVHAEQMAPWGIGWGRNDHLVFVAPGAGGGGRVEVPVEHAGRYRVKIDYTMAPVFGAVELAVNGGAPFEAGNLFWPQVGLVSVVYDGVTLNKGPNDFTFTVQGKDAASSHYHFAIDRIVVSKEDDEGERSPEVRTREDRREALDRALSWMLAHPADEFDGGRNAMYGEVVTLYHLALNVHLGDSRSICLKQIEERFRRLNSKPAYRTQPDEFELLVAVAYIARRLDIEFHAFEAVADAVRRRAEAIYGAGSGVRPLFLGEYFNRLNPAAAVPCNIEHSILYREYSERRLWAALAGEVDRTRASEVSSALFAIAADVCAVTDFGIEPLPRSEVLADKEFWASLCEDGIRWSRETGNTVLVARLVQAAQCFGVESMVPSFQDAVDDVVRHQDPDGCFGVGNPRSPNAFRDGVLAGSMAIASSF